MFVPFKIFSAFFSIASAAAYTSTCAVAYAIAYADGYTVTFAVAYAVA